MRLWTYFGVTATLLAGAMPAIPANAQNPCASATALRLIHGKIHTMDGQNRVVDEVTIQAGRFAYVGPIGNHALDPCTKVIDLHGRTVVPGLIDNHNHIVLFGMRPGHDIRLETATTIPQALALLKHRSQTIPARAWVTSLGDWSPAQFKENREPTLAELDSAVPNNPVLIDPAGGAAVTNSLGKTFFEGKGIAVSAQGAIAAGAPFLAALNALRAIQTPADEREGTLYAMRYTAQYGLTTSVDMGAFPLPGTPDMATAAATDGLESLNSRTMYDAFLALHREHKMLTRLRIYFLPTDTAMDVPMLRQYLLNNFPDFGDNMMKIAGIGEFATNWRYNWRAGERPANYEAALQLVAKSGWAFQQHTLSLAEDQFTTDTFEKVNAVTPIASLHWSIAHVPYINLETLNRLKAMGAGVAVHGWRYLNGAPRNSTEPAGPPYRTVLESGIHAGAGSDAAAVSVLDPWLIIYYMVTGKDSAGVLINPGQTVTRQQAMELYTADNGWFTHEEDQLGTIEPGKLGDLVVLNHDYFDPAKVSDEGIKGLQSVLTVVGGREIYTSAEVGRADDARAEPNLVEGQGPVQ